MEKHSKRDNGSGTIYQRGNGTWVGRISVSQNGKPGFKYVSGKSEAEVKRKIRDFQSQNAIIPASRITVEDYLQKWMKIAKSETIRRSSYDRIENTIKFQIAPYIGMIQLQQLTSDDVQTMLNTLKNDGFSHSTVKKSYDCMKVAMRYASIKEDIRKDPMLLVKMPKKELFEQKEIRFFTEKELALIVEESSRLYSNGKPVYPYGQAFILVANTGLRLGEVIGLKKTDFDEETNSIHVRRNLQSVKKRDSNGNAITGKVIVPNATKTYSGDRIIGLNSNALDAIRSLISRSVDSEFVVCDKYGKVVPPERLERSFYRVLANAGLEKTGMHSLRHTFASRLFAKNVDIKTISKLLGHANVQITINTYIHLLRDTNHEAVAKLEE